MKSEFFAIRDSADLPRRADRASGSNQVNTGKQATLNIAGRLAISDIWYIGKNGQNIVHPYPKEPFRLAYHEPRDGFFFAGAGLEEARLVLLKEFIEKLAGVDSVLCADKKRAEATVHEFCAAGGMATLPAEQVVDFIKHHLDPDALSQLPVSFGDYKNTERNWTVVVGAQHLTLAPG